RIKLDSPHHSNYKIGRSDMDKREGSGSILSLRVKIDWDPPADRAECFAATPVRSACSEQTGQWSPELHSTAFSMFRAPVQCLFWNRWDKARLNGKMFEMRVPNKPNARSRKALVRFSVGDAETLTSHSWKVWSEKQSGLYLTCRDSFKETKVFGQFYFEIR